MDHHTPMPGLSRVPPTKRLLLFLGSLLVALYALAPIAWLVSSSMQSEAEITSVPPHWMPDDPTLDNFRAIFKSSDEVVTYETRKQGDTATGGFIPSTAANLLPAMKNSMIVAVVVGVLVGSLAGMSAGWVDAALMWLTDLFLALPLLPLLAFLRGQGLLVI